MNPPVSIVLTYFDYADWIVEAVKSVHAQSYSPLELIVVDDCSPVEPADSILKRHGLAPCKIIRNKANLGPAQSCNIAVAHASAELIVPLDSDDWLDATYVEKTVSLLLDKNVDGVYTQTAVFGEQNFVHTPDLSILTLLCGDPGPTTFLYKRKVFEATGGYKSHVYHHDNEFWLAALRCGHSFARLDQPLYHYRKHGRGRSAQNREWEIPVLAREHRDLFEENLEAVLLAQERRWWSLSDQYGHLHREFHALFKEHERLRQELAALLAGRSQEEDLLKRAWRKAKRTYHSLVAGLSSGKV